MVGGLELLGVIHFRSRSRLDFLELGKRAEAGSFRLAGAAAGGGKKREDGSDEGSEDTDHGSDGADFKKEMSPVIEIPPGSGKLFGRCHVGRLARSRCGTWAAGSGEERGSGGDEGKFHVFCELVFDGLQAHVARQSAARLAVKTIPARQKTAQDQGSWSALRGWREPRLHICAERFHGTNSQSPKPRASDLL
jgi:hypothetical protein